MTLAIKFASSCGGKARWLPGAAETSAWGDSIGWTLITRTGTARSAAGLRSAQSAALPAAIMKGETMMKAIVPS